MKSTATLVASVTMLATAHPAWANPDPVVEAISERVDFQSQTGRLTIAGGEIVSTVGLPQIYGEGGYQPLWRDPAKVRELISLVQESYEDGLSPVDYHLTPLARLWPTVQANPTPANVADLDILATDAYSLLLYHLYFGKVDPRSLEPTWNFSTREITDRQAVDFVRDAITSGRLRAAVDAVRPSHWMYTHGRDILRSYRGIAAEGGWPTVPAGETLKPGMSDPRVMALRRRLAITGDLTGQSLDADLYDDALATAVRSFQQRHRLTVDGEGTGDDQDQLLVDLGARVLDSHGSLLGSADVILHDPAIPAAILDRARADAMRIALPYRGPDLAGLVLALTRADPPTS